MKMELGCTSFGLFFDTDVVIPEGSGLSGTSQEGFCRASYHNL
jgi:hypothetical protein